MFKNNKPYLLVTLLVGILMGCSSTNPLVEKTQDHLKNKDMKGALASSKKLIDQEPANPLGYYFKGTVLGDIGQNKENPADGESYYKKMNKSFDQSQSIADTMKSVPDKVKTIHKVKESLWKNELNTGVKIAKSDSLQKTMNNPMQKSMAHVKNATVILPKEALSWQALSQIAQVNKSYDEAAKAKEKYFEVAPDSSISANDYLLLGSFYFRMDKQGKVVDTFEKGFKKFPKNEKLASNLADAYTQAGESEKAVSTTRKLVEKYPDNAQYHLAFATQLYQKALDIRDNVSSNKKQIQKLQESEGSTSEAAKQKIAKLKKENSKLKPKVKDLTNEAEKNLKTSIELDSQNANAYNTMGIIYQNRAKDKFDARNMTEDNAKANKLNKQGEDLLSTSMKYYEKATEIDPDNKSYWRSLYSIYVTLGKDKKANKAKKKAGIK